MIARDTATGMTLAALVVGSWAGLLSTSLFVVDWSRAYPVAPLAIALQCWLFVGLFIVAHDCMHGSLAPGRPRLNRWVGRLCVLLYAGFDYDRLRESHHAHHRHSGTAHDPDFTRGDPSAFWPWYGDFFRHYFGLRSFVLLTVAGVLPLMLLAGVDLATLLAFWALPALLSSIQLFYFGTYLPHRHTGEPFRDAHNARGTAAPWLLSLLSCFHFGHHHAHHAQPSVPWWRLPHVRIPTGETR